MLFGKTWKFWVLALVGFVFVSCCGLIGLVGVFGRETPPTTVSNFQPTAVVVEPTAIPTAIPTAKPAPTKDPLEECKPQVKNYLSTQAIVGRLLADSMTMVSEGDLVGGYKEFDRARSAYNVTNPPACDDDVIVLHNKMNSIMTNLGMAFTAMSEGDFNTATGYIQESGPVIQDMTRMVEDIGRKYDF